MTQIYAKLEQDDELDSTSCKTYSNARKPPTWRSCTSLCDSRLPPTPCASLPSVKRKIGCSQRLENGRGSGWGSASCLINQKRRAAKNKGVIVRHKSQILTQLLQLSARSLENISSDPDFQINIYKPHIYQLVDRSLIGTCKNNKNLKSSSSESGDQVGKSDLVFTIYL